MTDMKTLTRLLAALLCVLLLSLPALAEETAAPAERTAEQVIRELVIYYGRDGSEADGKAAQLLEELRGIDPDAGAKWERILELWKKWDTNPEIYEGILPDGLPDTEELCLVVLGFQLNPDGSMKDELTERLKVALACAQKYPRAYIACTGGGTASQNEQATEAGKMAEWLLENGVDPQRVIVEDRSLTTAQNAIYTCQILAERYPQVRQLAIVSSDYHIATGTVLFGAEAILRDCPFTVAGNAAWKAPSGSLSSMFRAGALIELAGDRETAYNIYYDTYDIHELPPLN